MIDQADGLVVSSSRQAIQYELGKRFVVKPLGSGFVADGSNSRVFFATLMDVDDCPDEAFARAPVIAQEYIVADEHL